MSDYELFMRGYAMMGATPEFTDTDYAIAAAFLFGNGFITAINWDTEIGEYIKRVIDEQDDELKSKMIEWGTIATGSKG